MRNEQFFSRNQQEILNVISYFREATDSYQNQLTLYMDSKSWEVFDMRVAKVIFRADFKKLKSLQDFLRQFRQDLINIGCAEHRLKYGGRKTLSVSESVAVRHIADIYTIHDNYFFKYEPLKNYYYERNNKENS